MNPIPTRLNGIQFRSRLEARWASVFSALRWRWEYEPIDLNGYIPDFILLFEAGPVLVEVKPAWRLDEMGAAMDKIDASGWETKNRNSAMVVGATYDYRDEGDRRWSHYSIIGALRQEIKRPFRRPEYWWEEAVLHYCTEGKHHSVHHSNGRWDCTVCGAYCKDHGNRWLGDPGDFEQIWKDAGNNVQWQA
jgi:hypothetical protein